MINRDQLGGVIHTYQKFDPTEFPSPTAPPPDMVSPAFEHLLYYGNMRRLTDEELALFLELVPVFDVALLDAGALPGVALFTHGHGPRPARGGLCGRAPWRGASRMAALPASHLVAGAVGDGSAQRMMMRTPVP